MSSILKTPLLDGLSGATELRDFLELVPNFSDTVKRERESIAGTIDRLYEASCCHHKYPKNYRDLQLDDNDMRDFLHSVIIVATNKIDRIETLYASDW